MVSLLFGILHLIPFIASSWVFTHVWFWFVVPFGVPAIGIAHAAGIILTFRFMCFKPKPDARKLTREQQEEELLLACLVPIIGGAVACIIHFFM